MDSPLTCKQRSVIEPLLEVFLTKSTVRPKLIAHTYQQLTRSNFSCRKYDFRNIDAMIFALGIFEQSDDGEVSICKSKLLGVLITPLDLLNIPQDALEEHFRRVNGFDPQILCRYCGTDSLQQLIVQYRSDVGAYESRDVHPSRTSHSNPRNLVGPRVLQPHHPYPLLPSPPTPRATLLPPLAATVTSVPVFSRFPNYNIPPEEETYLPALPSVRKSMETPNASLAQLKFPSFSRKESKNSVLDKLETYLKNRIMILSSQGKHLPAQVISELAKGVIKRVNDMAQKPFFISFKDVKCLSQFSMRYTRVFEFIRCYCWNSTITSLFELQKAILLLEDCSSFEDLQMGPILTHPLVKDLFKPPSDLQVVPEMSAFMIQSLLAKFLSKNKNRAKQDFNEFLGFLANEQRAAGPEYLCIRISSFPLALKMNFNYWKTQRIAKEQLQDQIEKDIAEAANFEVENLKRKLARMGADERELARKNPINTLEDVLQAAKDLFAPRLQSNVLMFMHNVLSKPALRQCFLLAIYQGAYGIQNTHEVQQQGQVYMQYSGIHVNDFISTVPTPRNDIINQIHCCLQTVPFPVDLESLAHIEQELIDHFHVHQFTALEQGSFLQFISRHPELLRSLGGNQLGTSVVNSPLRGHVISFIQQLKAKNKDNIVRGIIRQFQVTSIEHLQCGNVDKLINDAGQQSQKSSATITYQLPLLDQQQTSQAGVLGVQTPHDALECLKKAPLLVDLANWSHWELVYAPHLGSLSQFLIEHCNGIVHALEVAPGRLFRVALNTSVSEFIKALNSTDHVGTAGHLASLVVKSGSVSDVPVQMLATHVRTKLEQLITEQNQDTVVQFIFLCLIQLPLLMCQLLAPEVFIAPLRKVTSTAAVTGMLGLCRNLQERLFLQALGMSIGIKHWADDFKEMQLNPETVTIQFPTKVQSDSERATQGHTIPKRVDKDDTTLNKVPVPLVDTVSSSTPPIPLASPSALIESATPKEDIKCKEIILSIRQDEFGYGQKLEPKQEEIARKQREREGRGLQRLSQELYSKDTHFVLELVQNADDNSYPQMVNESVPSLKFILASNCVVVLNNECGFSEENIRAICDVGKSTKDAHKSGYIGQKGIGFKSVFRVSDTPEIHSSGFHIKFDTKSGPIGYILPHWIEHSFIEGEIGYDELNNHNWTTRIVLPLKANSSQSQSMVKKFHDIHPSLLLFLNRLRCIMIEDKESGQTQLMKRIDKGEGLTSLMHNDHTENWLVVRKNMTGAEQYKPGVVTTDLALAFPIQSNLDTPPSARELQTQQVFAYLPLRSYGFRFIVQGDFDLPSSREDVNSDSAWNQWLREEIPSLFVDAMQRIKELPGITTIPAIALFLQFVPLEGEVHDFFKPVTGHILRLLQGKQCLPTEFTSSSSINYPENDAFRIIVNMDSGNTEEENLVEWKQPSKLLKVSNELIRECIPQSLLLCAVGLSYLNSSLQSYVSDELRSHLEIGGITIDHLIAIADQAVSSYSTHKQTNFQFLKEASCQNSPFPEEFPTELNPHDMFVNWVAYWMACVSSVLEETKDVSSNTLKSIKKLPIVPLSDGSFTSLQSTVFFNKELKNIGVFKALFDTIDMVDPNLVHSPTRSNQIVAVHVRKLLDKLGVKELYPHEIIEHYILPRFTKERYQDSEDLTCLYLAYIKNSIAEGAVKEDRMIAALKDSLLVVTNSGLKTPSKEPVHFSSSYKCEWDLMKLFPDVQWTTISSKYIKLTRATKASDLSNWRKFLMKLGVQSGLAVRRSDCSVDFHTNTIWNDLPNWKRSPDGCYTVRDYQCVEFESIVTSVQDLSDHMKVQKMKDLAEILDQSWNSEYKQYVQANYYDGSNSKELGSTESSFGYALHTLPWLPAVVMSNYEPYEVPLLQGKYLFENSSRNTKLLQSFVPYLGAVIKENEFLKYLAVQQDISSDDLLNYLCNWSKNESFRTSVEHMKSVYMFLDRKSGELLERNGSTHIGDAFKNRDLIFVPLSGPWAQADKVVEGQFRSIDKVSWSDHTTVLYSRQKSKKLPSHLPRILSFYYHNNDQHDHIKDVFLRFGVSKDLQVHHLVDLLEFNASENVTTDKDDIKNFRSIAECIADSVSVAHRDQPESIFDKKLVEQFLSGIAGRKVFPSENKKWVTLEGLYINDMPDAAEQFANVQEINFILLPPTQSSHYGDHLLKCFTEMCKIPLLSASVVLRVDPGMIMPSEELKEILYHILPLIQSYLFSKHQEEHDRLEYKQGFGEYLKKLQLFSSIDLTCRYVIQIGDKEIISNPTSMKGCYLQEDPPVLYIVVSAENRKFNNKFSLVDVLKQLFFSHISNDHRKAKDFLTQLIVNDPRTDDEKKSICAAFSLSDIPSDINRWNITVPERLTQSPQQEEDNNQSSDESDDYESSETDEGADKEPAGLTAWPPKAAVREPDIQKQGKVSTRIYSPLQENQTSNEDIITLKDVQEIEEVHDKKAIVNQHSRMHDTQDVMSPHSNQQQNIRSEQQPSFEDYPKASSPTEQGSRRESSGIPFMRHQEQQQQQQHHQWRPAAPNFSNMPESLDMSVLMETITISEGSSMDILLQPDDGGQASKEAIGRWGEQFVYNLLKTQKGLLDDISIIKVKWINKDQESGSPYDIIVTVEEGLEYFIEVKTTTSSNKELIPISWKELKFAESKGKQYLLFRVYNAGKESAKLQLKYLRNLYHYLEKCPSVRVFLTL